MAILYNKWLPKNPYWDFWIKKSKNKYRHHNIQLYSHKQVNNQKIQIFILKNKQIIKNCYQSII